MGDLRFPRVIVDLEKLTQNAAGMKRLCDLHHVDLAAVIKVCCGSPEVARAVLAGGVKMLADSRVENVRKMRSAGVDAPFMMLRLPMPEQAEEVVRNCEVSLNSEPATLQALDRAALKLGKRHKVVLMVDVGDRREGVLPEQAVEVARQAEQLGGLELAGLGTNLMCYGGVIPSDENMRRLVEAAERVQEAIGRKLETMSAGNSSSINLLKAGGVPEGAGLRIGEGIVLGTEPAGGTPIPGQHLDVFTLEAQVIELKRKPSLPEGDIGKDAFGTVPHFEDRGVRMRAILGIGRQDVDPAGLTPLDEGVEVIGASSDHLICDVEAAAASQDAGGARLAVSGAGLEVGDAGLKVGGTLRFRMNYSALLRTMTSDYVYKEYVRG